ncbi:hypothetical protein JXJ21_09765, partial [candidate division KSB1 bacterium]|nr:hypothetical protein [candidate division KSB1 bacterium]
KNLIITKPSSTSLVPTLRGAQLRFSDRLLFESNLPISKISPPPPTLLPSHLRAAALFQL